jgi:hypothetical protein
LDSGSQSVARFLESLQDAMQILGEVRNHYRRRGAHPERPYLVLSRRPFRVHEGGSVREFNGSVALGLIVKGTDDKEYDLSVDVLWDADRWTIQTQAWVESETNQRILRELPVRNAVDLVTCTTEISGAVGDLTSFADLVPGRSPTDGAS